MMLDVWWNVLVVRMSALQEWIVRMWLRVVPVQLLLASPDFVTVPINGYWQAITDEPLAHHQANIMVKEQFACDSS